MTPREKEIALEAAARSSNPIEHARKVLEAEAFLRGERPPFVVWPTRQIDLEEQATWHEERAAEARRRIAYRHAAEEWRKANPARFPPPIEELLPAKSSDAAVPAGRYGAALSVFAQVFPILASQPLNGESLKEAATDTAAALAAGLTALQEACGSKS